MELQFDLRDKIDYYMPRFFENRSRDPSLRASGPVVVGSALAEFILLTIDWLKILVRSIRAIFRPQPTA